MAKTMTPKLSNRSSGPGRHNLADRSVNPSEDRSAHARMECRRIAGTLSLRASRSASLLE